MYRLVQDVLVTKYETGNGAPGELADGSTEREPYVVWSGEHEPNDEDVRAALGKMYVSQAIQKVVTIDGDGMMLLSPAMTIEAGNILEVQRQKIFRSLGWVTTGKLEILSQESPEADEERGIGWIRL